MHTWVGPPCSSRYTGFRDALPPTTKGLLRRATGGIYLVAAARPTCTRLILRSSTPGTHPRLSLFSARRDGEIDPIFDSFRRRSWPGSVAGTTHAWGLGTRGTHLHSLLGGQSLSSLSRGQLVALRESAFHHPPIMTVKAIYPRKSRAGVRSCCACLFVVLVGLVCADNRPTACASACTNL